ncbi:hypothetical protein CR513_29563, partial [Mucuna pruriens]
MVMIVQLGFHLVSEQFWTNIRVLHIFKIRARLSRQIELYNFNDYQILGGGGNQKIKLKYQQRRQEL